MRTPGEPIPSLDDTGEMPTGWTPEQQIAHMLDLCEAQMESALSESDVAVDALIKAFTGLADTAHSLDAIAKQLASDANNNTSGELLAQVSTIRDQMASAVVAFQFYDKLTQRLGHVRYSLSSLALFVCNRSQTSQREQWRRLFTTLRRLYRTDEERQLFQLMIEGQSANDANAKENNDTTERRAAAGEIEIF